MVAVNLITKSRDIQQQQQQHKIDYFITKHSLITHS